MKTAQSIALDASRNQSRGGEFLKSTSNVLNNLVFIAALGVMVIAIVPYGATDAWWEAIFECAVFGLTAIWIVEDCVGGWKFKHLFVLLPLAILTAYAFAQTIQWPAGWPVFGIGTSSRRTLTIDGYQTYLTARKTLALTLFLGLLLSHTSTPRRFHWLVRVTIGLGLGSAIFAILRQFLQNADSNSGFLLPFLSPGVGYGQFISANVFAYLMEMVFGLLIGLVLGGGIKRERLLVYAAITIVVWTALVLSSSRGAMIGLACQVFFALIVGLRWYSERKGATANRFVTFLTRSKLVRVMATLLIVGTLTAGVLWVGAGNLAWKFQGTTQGPGATSQQDPDGLTRKEIWGSTWKLIKHYPWTGVGFGAYSLGIPQYETSTGKFKLEQAHNDYLDLAASGGVVAVLLAGWFVVLVIRRSRPPFRSRDHYRRAASLGAVSGILSVGIHSLVDFGLQVTGIAVVFAALIVIAVADSRVESVARERTKVN